MSEKLESFVEKAWWTIPPVFLIFVYIPLTEILLGPSFTLDLWINVILSFLEFRRGGVYAIFMFGLMLLGYFIVNNKKLSLKYKITIPSLFGVIGWWVGFVVALFLYME